MATFTLPDIIDIAERKGETFEAAREVVIPANTIVYSLFRTGNKPVILFERKIGFNGVGINTRVYRDPVLISAGSLEPTIRNSNDINPKLETVSLYTGTTFSDIGIETRTPKFLFASDSNQAAGSVALVVESAQLILPNSDIILTLQNRDTNSPQTAFALIRWAEPDHIPGLIIQNGVFVSYNGEGF